MSGRIVLLGATGYTGGLVLDALRRRGTKPVVAGRNRTAVARLAADHGDLEYALADVTDAASVAALVGPGDVLITTVGPFERFGPAVARAAAESGAHYLDTTGEVGFVLDLRRQLHDHARESGSVMLPAFGYDYVPGILAGTLAAQQAGPEARSVDIGYFATGPLWRGLSQGTRTTMRDGLTLPSPRWYRGRLIEERTAARVRDFTVRGRRRTAFLVSGSEVLLLPAAFPDLDTVTVYNGWFPSLSRAIRVMSASSAVATRTALGRKLIDIGTRPMIGPAGGPDATERARTRSHVVAVASTASSGPRAEVHVEGPSSYTLTGELIAWAAGQLATRPARTAGVVGPVEAFGLDTLRSGCAELGLTQV
ncbi:saccharopine dehydrogenase family protein [Nocardia mikamii]|uniref:saccharopine dehydrogenase family protein n=1 Tax=Nocardia mikamii TaxID=508464 RepID=UPI0007A41C92|nr:saccharopine dehydrogenase NADP-binding domain-containing protein [Nocardia mikamii]